MKFKNAKIAFVSDAVYPYNKGGKEKRLYEISTRLANRGYDVHIYCMKWWKQPGQERTENSVHLHAISKYYPLYSGPRRSILEAVMFSLACFKLIKEDFDIIDADHMPHMVLFPLKLVCVLKKKRLIVTWNEVWGRKYWVEYMGVLGNVAYLIERTSVWLPDRIISVSRLTKNRLLENLKCNKQISIVPNGIDYNLIRNVKPSVKASDVIFGGRLLKHKNVSTLIRSMSIVKERFPNIKCLIIGDGPEKSRLVDLTNKLNLGKCVEFTGIIENHKTVYSLIKSSKVFVLPSTREGFGIVAIESNACGKPVITVDHKENAAKDLIKEGKNGSICKLDENSLAENIFSLLNKGLAGKMEKECLDTAKRYDWDKFVDKLEAIYINE